MPNGQDGEIISPHFIQAHTQSRTGQLPPSDKQTLAPQYLLQHENHFDPNVYTPEQLIEKGFLKGTPDPIKTA